MNSRVILRIGVLLMLWLPPMTAAAQGAAEFQFANAAAISVIWPEPIVVEVQNNTTLALPLTVRIENFVMAGKTIEAASMMLSSTESVDLPAAGSAVVAIQMQKSLLPAAGVYTGSLVVFGSEPTHNLVIRKPIQLTVKTTSREPALPGIPGVASYKVTAYRWQPLFKARPVCFTGCEVPVINSLTHAASPTGVLGYLTGDKGGALLVSAAPYTTPVGVKLAYEFSGDGLMVGAYTGKVALAPADEKKGEVALTVNVKDIVIWPILLLVVGVVITAWAKSWLGVRRHLFQLVEREAKASRLLQEVGQSVSGYAIVADAEQKLAKIRQELNTLNSGSLNQLMSPQVVEATKKRHAQVEKDQEVVEEQLALWQAWAQKLLALRAALLAADSAISEAQKPPAVVFLSPLEKPQFYAKAAGLLQGQELTLVELQRADAQLKQAIRLAETWEPWEQALSWTRGRIGDLLNARSNMTPAEQRLLDNAQQQANSAWVDLWEATDLADLETRKTEAKINGAREAVRRLMHHLPERTEPRPTWPRGAEAIRPVAPARTVSVEPAERERYARQTLWLGDRALVLIAVTVALATGLNDLYFGKNFGTPADWLAALTWGAGSQIGVDLVKTALDRLFKVA